MVGRKLSSCKGTHCKDTKSETRVGGQPWCLTAAGWRRTSASNALSWLAGSYAPAKAHTTPSHCVLPWWGSAGGCPRTQQAQHSSPTQCYVPQSEPIPALMHQQAVHAAPDPAIPAAMPLLQAHVGIAALAAQQHTPFCITLLPAQIPLVTMGPGPPSSLPHKPCFPWNPNSGTPQPHAVR